MQLKFTCIFLARLARLASVVSYVGCLWGVMLLGGATSLHAQKNILHKELFQRETFTLRTYIEIATNQATFTYTIESIEKGALPQLTLEWGHKPFSNLVMTAETLQYTQLTHFPLLAETASPATALNEAQSYLMTTYAYQGILPTQTTTLKIPPWKIFVLADKEIFPITLAATTLHWERPLHKKTLFFYSSLPTHYQIGVIIGLLGIVLLIIGGLGMWTLRRVKEVKRRKLIEFKLWQRIKKDYTQQNIEELYYQRDKSHYFLAVKICIERTLGTWQAHQTLPMGIAERFTEIRQQLTVLHEKTTPNPSAPRTLPATKTPGQARAQLLSPKAPAATPNLSFTLKTTEKLSDADQAFTKVTTFMKTIPHL